MSVSPVTSVANSASTSATATAATVDYNSFLKLLMEQLKTQDPTKPMDSTEFMGQLASFSQVEQSVNTNTKLNSLLASSSLTQAESAIGRTITTADGSASGKVTAVRVTDQGAYAELDNGGEILLGSGVTLS